MRENLVKSGLLEAVIGLGAGLFYNSPMEAVVVVLRANRSAMQRDSVLFVNAVELVTRERAQSFLRPTDQKQILDAYEDFKDVPGLAKVASGKDIAAKDYSLSIPLYVEPAPAATGTAATKSVAYSVKEWRLAAADADKALNGLRALLAEEVQS